MTTDQFKVVSMKVLQPQRWLTGELIDPNNPYVPELMAQMEASRLREMKPEYKHCKCVWRIIILD